VISSRGKGSSLLDEGEKRVPRSFASEEGADRGVEGEKKLLRKSAKLWDSVGVIKKSQYYIG